MNSPFAPIAAAVSKDAELARDMLERARLAATEFLQTFQAARRGSTGNSTDPQQDLLRAMLVFAAAGLDAALKQLIRDGIPKLLCEPPSQGCQRALEVFALRRLRAEAQDPKILARVITSGDPRQRMIGEWVDELTAGSLQSVEAVQLALNSFGINSREIFSSGGDGEKLRAAFLARHQIVHEMDLLQKADYKTARKRRQRGQGEMVAHATTVLNVAAEVLAKVDAALVDELQITSD